MHYKNTKKKCTCILVCCKRHCNIIFKHSKFLNIIQTISNKLKHKKSEKRKKAYKCLTIFLEGKLVSLGKEYYIGMRAKSWHPEGLEITYSHLGLSLIDFTLTHKICLTRNMKLWVIGKSVAHQEKIGMRIRK